MNRRRHLFEAFGVELEYMLVHRDSLEIVPEVDQLFRDAAGSFVSDYEDGPISWSNELVRHVMEVKVSEPVASFAGLSDVFQRSLDRIQTLAAARNTCLMPTAMHPWMDPARETELWPHDYAEVYRTFDRIFDCRRHGWANLQSVHLNLPFCGDEEFARLHAAIRLVLPLLPGLAAASPIMEGRITGHLDSRLDVYVNNSRVIPHITGDIIPEPVFSRDAYVDAILQPMYTAIAPYDPEGMLQDEFLNARGAIARFDRNAIEIRLLDVQECPAADLAIVQAVVHAVRRQVEETWTPLDTQKQWSSARLKAILLAHIRDADDTIISDREFLAAWGYAGVTTTSRDLWRHILNDVSIPDAEPARALELILREGVLARRMLRRLHGSMDRPAIAGLYRELMEALRIGRPWSPA
ncbi:MAG TPA: glutamate-cysteine ligase family protein [Kiritimatiellia bacterium]|nr:glutamate-cysteine ligase family protein [Kiritimatiellia bacterium]HMO98420.1 glutamate-cysteine ligase family protein [Kiritimatiellia bacterium]HMP95838.1 glutamate-cysteine ligase family protein [Kiritimatiellia bacterium]